MKTALRNTSKFFMVVAVIVVAVLINSAIIIAHHTKEEELPAWTENIGRDFYDHQKAYMLEHGVSDENYVWDDSVVPDDVEYCIFYTPKVAYLNFAQEEKEEYWYVNSNHGTYSVSDSAQVGLLWRGCLEPGVMMELTDAEMERQEKVLRNPNEDEVMM